MNVIWSPLAIDRASEAAQFIAEDKTEAALHWLEGLFKSTDRLAGFPRSGRIVDEIGLPEYREVIFRSHRVIYRVEASSVSILTVRNSAQMLDPDELKPSEAD